LAVALSSLLTLIPVLALSPPQPAGEAAAVATTPADAPAAALDGLYPLWEQTATLQAPGAVQIGYGHAAVGLGPVQLGTQPILDLHGTLNLQAKVALLRRPRFGLALVVGGYHVPTEAESRTVGNLDPTGFANPYAPVWLFPVSLVKTLRLGTRAAVHWTSTALLSRSPDPQLRSLTGGQTLLLELFASPHWAARAHGGVEGWPVAPQAHAGLSFGYRASHLYGAAGVARRFTFEGEAANMVLLDGGLLFP
jgi:hypothetical protein